MTEQDMDRPLSQEEIDDILERLRNAPAVAKRVADGTVLRSVHAPDGPLYEALGVPFLDENGEFMVVAEDMETGEADELMLAGLEVVDGLSALGEQAE